MSDTYTAQDVLDYAITGDASKVGDAFKGALADKLHKRLEDKKIESLSKDLTSIMKFIEKLNKLNTDKTVPLTSIIYASLKSRKDEVKDEKIRYQVLKNSPEKNEEFFVVPKVIE